MGGEGRHATSTKKKKSEVAHFGNALFSCAAETGGDTTVHENTGILSQ